MIESGKWVYFNPLTNISDDGPLEFVATGSGDEYMDLSHTLLHVKAKIVKDDGSAVNNMLY